MDAAWAKVITDWAQFAAAGATGGALALWAYLARRDTNRGGQISALRADMDTGLTGISTRLTRIETRAEAGPTAAICSVQAQRMAALEQAVAAGVNMEDLKRIHARMDHQGEVVARVDGALSRIEPTL